MVDHKFWYSNATSKALQLFLLTIALAKIN